MVYNPDGSLDDIDLYDSGAMIDELEKRGYIVCHKDGKDSLLTHFETYELCGELDQRDWKNTHVEIETALDIVEQAGYNVSRKDDFKDMLWDLYQAKLNGDLDKKLHQLFVEYLNTWL